MASYGLGIARVCCEDVAMLLVQAVTRYSSDSIAETNFILGQTSFLPLQPWNSSASKPSRPTSPQLATSSSTLTRHTSRPFPQPSHPMTIRPSFLPRTGCEGLANTSAILRPAMARYSVAVPNCADTTPLCTACATLAIPAFGARSTGATGVGWKEAKISHARTRWWIIS